MIEANDLDTTIEEIHRTRERLAAKFGGDIKAILADARRRQAESDRPIRHATSAKSGKRPPLPVTLPTPPGMRVRTGRFQARSRLAPKLLR